MSPSSSFDTPEGTVLAVIVTRDGPTWDIQSYQCDDAGQVVDACWRVSTFVSSLMAERMTAASVPPPPESET